MNDTLKKLYAVVEDRKANPQEGSYTCYLFDKGLDKILKKVGEECAETIIAAKNGVQEETVGEISDLIYKTIDLEDATRQEELNQTRMASYLDKQWENEKE